MVALPAVVAWTATGVLTPIYYKPTWYSSLEYRIRKQGAYTESTTDPNGRLELILPVGEYEIIAYNPFHGMHTIHGKIDYAGQVVHHEVVFEDAATVAGQVVGVDGITPVPGVEVVLEANGLKGQKQRTDAQGSFRYELVPKGRVMVTAEGLAGNDARTGGDSDGATFRRPGARRVPPDRPGRGPVGHCRRCRPLLRYRVARTC